MPSVFVNALVHSALKDSIIQWVIASIAATKCQPSTLIITKDTPKCFSSVIVIVNSAEVVS